jgi:hypothetical protein
VFPSLLMLAGGGGGGGLSRVLHAGGWEGVRQSDRKYIFKAINAFKTRS